MTQILTQLKLNKNTRIEKHVFNRRHPGGIRRKKANKCSTMGQSGAAQNTDPLLKKNHAQGHSFWNWSSQVGTVKRNPNRKKGITISLSQLKCSVNLIHSSKYKSINKNFDLSFNSGKENIVIESTWCSHY